MSFIVDGEPVEAGGRADRLLSWDRVHDLVGLSRSTAWRLQRAGDFPIGSRTRSAAAGDARDRKSDGLDGGAGPPESPQTVSVARADRFRVLSRARRAPA